MPPSARATAHPAESASGWHCDPTVIDSSVVPAVQAVIRSSAATAAAAALSEHLGGGRHQGAISRWARQRDRHPVALQRDCAHDHTLRTGTDILNAMPVWLPHGGALGVAAKSEYETNLDPRRGYLRAV